MSKDRSASKLPVLEQLEARVLLTADLTAGEVGLIGEYAVDGVSEIYLPVPLMDPGAALPQWLPALPSGSNPSGPPIQNQVSNLQLLTDYDWFYGCSPTVGGMQAAWWDLELKLRSRDFNIAAFPGLSETNWAANWQAGLYPQFDSEPFFVPQHANGVVSGWQHTHAVDWLSVARWWSNYTWEGHAPDSISDFMLTSAGQFEGETNFDNVAWAMENFMAWDDPRTVVNESWSFNTQVLLGDPAPPAPAQPVPIDFLAYQAAIDANLPVHLLFLDTNPQGALAPPHSALGVGYYITPGANPRYYMQILTTWQQEGIRQWSYPMQTVSIPSWPYTAHYQPFGMMTMDLAQMPQQDMAAYFAIAYPEVSALEVSIGLGDPAAPVWEAVVYASGQNAGRHNLVQTDIDVTGAMPFLSQTEDWYLKVTDTAGFPADVAEIMDFQIRHGGYRWFTPDYGTPIPVGDTGIVRLSTDIVGEIQGTVWEDVDGDGVREGGEAELAGWTVYLDANENRQLDPAELFATTDAQGRYEFNDVPLGQHVVEVEVPAGWGQTQPAAGRWSGFLVGQTIDDADFGVALLGEIHGTKWHDLNVDGIKDAGESGLADWVVFLDDNQNGLLDADEAFTTTDANGDYSFTDLMPGDYVVAEQIGDEPGEVGYSWTQSFPAGGAHQVALISDQIVLGKDFGNYQGALADLRDNGDMGSSFSPALISPGESWSVQWQIFNAGTAAAGQFQVAFYASEDDTIDESDYYLGSATVAGVGAGGVGVADLTVASFPGLPAAEYYVGVIIDSNNQVVESEEFNNVGVDYDHYPLVVPGIRGTVWHDLNTDGVIDPGEPLVAGWTLYLDQDQNGQFDPVTEASTETDENGVYWFTGLEAGTYVVAQVLPADWQYTLPVSGSRQISLSGDEAVDNADFGNYQPDLPDLYDDGDEFSTFDPTGVLSPGDSWDVWWDIRNGGTAAAGEFQVDFYASEDDVITPDDHYLGFVTAPGLAAGAYVDLNLSLLVFPEVLAGEYYVGVIIDPLNAVTESNEDNNIGVDYDTYPFTISNRAELAGSGDAYSGFAATTVEVGDHWDAWWDVTNSGLADAGPFRVDFYASGNTAIKTDDYWIGSVLVPGVAAGETVNVDASVFQFSDIPPGLYYVGVIIDANDDILELDETNNTATDLDTYPLTVELTLPAIEGMVWHDRNNNGVVEQDEEHREPSLAGWMVYLDANDNGAPDPGERMTLTDADGRYVFPGVPAGTYTVREVLRPGWQHTTPDDGALQVVIGDGELVQNVDFGNAQHSKIAGIVGHDINGDGILQINEPGLPFQTVRLYLDSNENGRMDLSEQGSLQEVVTDDFGGFIFTGLMPGPYMLEYVLPPGTLYTNPSTGEFAITVTSAQLIDRIFLGAMPVEFHGVKWNDLDGDGVRDAEEPILEGWVMYLDRNDNSMLDAGEVWTTTDGDTGHYAFTGLRPGTYIIREVQQPGWVQSWPDAVGVYQPAPPWAPPAPPVPWGYRWTLASNGYVGNFDFGNFLGSAISGTVFHDIDADGTQKPVDEPGLAGWIVDMFLDQDGDGLLTPGTPGPPSIPGDPTFQTVTDVDGNYSFTGLVPGTYILSEVLQVDWVQSVPLGGAHAIDVISGDDIPEVNFGNFQYGRIYGSKWHDLNADGVWDGGEPGLPGWKIYLDQNQNGVWDEGETFDITDTVGGYSFVDLIPGPFTVGEVPQVDWIQSAPAAGTHEVTIQSGDIVLGLEFANFQYAELTGSKWHDLNGDSIRDAGEPGLPGWTIFLDENANGQLDAGETSTLTDAQGDYSLVDLLPGAYLVGEVVEDGWVQSAPASGGYMVSPLSSEVIGGLDFGNYEYGQIQGAKWHDLNVNGVWDAGEPGLPGWTIYLDQNQNGVYDGMGYATFDSTDVPVLIPDLQTVSSDVQVSGLAGPVVDVNVTLDITHTFLGDLDISLISPSGTMILLSWWLGGVDMTDTTFDDEADTPIWAGVAPYTGQFQPVMPLATLIGENPNGTWTLEVTDSASWDTGMLNSWSISITVPSLVEQATLTDGDGNYAFPDLSPGTYVVAEVVEDGWVQLAPAGGTHQIAIQSGDLVTDVNFGNAEGAEIHGVKWHDLNGDGIRDPGEPGLLGWTISTFLDLDGDGELGDGESTLLAVTGPDGSYSFTGLMPGDHVVAELSQPGWSQTAPVGETYQLTLGRGQVAQDIDFGNARSGEIHGLKWHDLNNNGIMNVNEPLLEGWVIFLDANDNGARDPDEVLATTDVDGAYAFTGLRPGTYTVAEIVQPGWEQSSPVGGTHLVTVMSGDAVTGVNFGNVKLGEVRGGKFHDLNADGLWDAGEPGLAGWTIFSDQNLNGLLDAGEPFATTDVNGDYVLLGLELGTHVVTEQPQVGWMQSAPAGGTYQLDIVSGSAITGTDFGNYQYGQVSGIVFSDENHDGIQNDPVTEPGLGGWQVAAFLDANGNGALDAGENEYFAITDAVTGGYDLTGLPPGAYLVSVELQGDTDFTWPAGGTHQLTVNSGQAVGDMHFGIKRVPGVDDLGVQTPEDQLVSDVVTGRDADGNLLHSGFEVVDGPAHAADLVMADDGSFTYTPAADYNGLDSFTFRVGDGGEYSRLGTATVTVAPVNDAPEAKTPTQPLTVDEDPAAPLLIVLGATDLETAYADLDFQIVDPPDYGTLTEVGQGRFEYQPDLNYNGADQFRFRVTDTGDPAGGDQGWGYDGPMWHEADAPITVNPVNDAPTGEYVKAETIQDDPVDIQLTGDDVETPAGDLLFGLHTPPVHGSVSFNGSVVTYTPEPGYSGIDRFQFAVTDDGDPSGSGNVLSAAGTVDVVVARAVHFNARTRVQLQPRVADPLVVVVSMRGPGEGVLILGEDDITRLELFGTGMTSNVNVITRGRGLEVNIGEIIVHGSLGGLNAKTANLLGDMTVGGSMRRLTLNHVTDEHVITIGAPTTTRDTVRMTFDCVADTSIFSQTPISSLTVTEWLDSEGARDEIVTPWLGRLTSRGQRARRYVVGSRGDFEADLTLSGIGARRNALNGARIAGELVDSIWNVGGHMGSLSVGGRVVDSQVRAQGNMANVTVGAAERSDFLAGVAAGVARRPGSAADFDLLATIRSFRVRGLRYAAPRYLFIDTNIAASTIGVVSLRNAGLEVAGEQSGILAVNAGTAREIRMVTHYDTLTRERWRWTPRDGIVFAMPELDIELLA